MLGSRAPQSIKFAKANLPGDRRCERVSRRMGFTLLQLAVLFSPYGSLRCARATERWGVEILRIRVGVTFYLDASAVWVVRGSVFFLAPCDLTAAIQIRVRAGAIIRRHHRPNPPLRASSKP